MMSKVMESIIAAGVIFPLFKFLISAHQFVFHSIHSTLDILLLLSQQWMGAVDLDLWSGLSSI